MQLPLSFVGQEYIWTQVFASYNLTFAEQQTFYGGPAFLPWFRMGNIRGWGGPLSMEWILARRDLQILMLTRMRSLGMRTVLSAFAGHVPAAFATRFPTAKITRSPDWANFNAGNPATAAYSDVYMIDPTDPMYTEVGAKFIETQASVYGTDHIVRRGTTCATTLPAPTAATLSPGQIEIDPCHATDRVSALSAGNSLTTPLPFAAFRFGRRSGLHSPAVQLRHVQ